jgi:hypothetical protein
MKPLELEAEDAATDELRMQLLIALSSKAAVLDRPPTQEELRKVFNRLQEKLPPKAKAASN